MCKTNPRQIRDVKNTLAREQNRDGSKAADNKCKCLFVCLYCLFSLNPFSFAVVGPGFYQMCFSNFHNRFGMMQVFLSFGVHYDGSQDPAKQKEMEKKKKEEASKDLNNTLSVIEVNTS